MSYISLHIQLVSPVRLQVRRFITRPNGPHADVSRCLTPHRDIGLAFAFYGKLGDCAAFIQYSHKCRKFLVDWVTGSARSCERF